MPQVVIVGGGMVGLSLSLMLAKANIRVKLLEAIQYPDLSESELHHYHSSFDARNSALSRRSVEIYNKLGLWARLQEYATPIRQVHITEEGRGRKSVV